MAPYSYDLIDNRGRRSPQTLTPGADELHLGQRIAVVLDLTDVDEGRQWTGVAHPAAAQLFGPFAMTYAAEPAGPHASRIVCRLTCAADGRVGWVRSRLLAWGDLVMMRRQLLNLKGLAEG